MELKNKVAIVTGSGRGVGRALALEFARQGAAVVCCARREAEIGETVRMIEADGGRGLAVATDVTDPTQVDRLAQRTLDAFGQIDVLFNNAGSFNVLGGLWEVDPEAWWHDVTVNLRGPMLTCRAVLPHMIQRDSGIIINMSGGGSTVPLPGGSGYGSSKTALLRMTEGLAKELEHEGSHVLAMLMGPGLVRTEMTQLQVDTPAGRKWIPSTQDAFEAGTTRSPEDCAKATVRLLAAARPEFNGRVFGVGSDFDDLTRRAAEIRDKDLHVLRARNA